MSILTPGKVNVLIDSQFGSSGKGLMAAYIAEREPVNVAVSNGGPNSGHTAYVESGKLVTHHLPMSFFNGSLPLVYLCAGSVIDPEVLQEELKRNVVTNRLVVHPHAAIITADDKDEENRSGSGTEKVASTGQGVGRALSRKILREAKLAKDHWLLNEMGCIGELHIDAHLRMGQVVLMEVPQGFGLSLNSGLYPYTTSREVSVSQALSDLQVYPKALGNVIMCLRTYPIRVGHANGNSGPFWEGSQEIEWTDVGVVPETTTVTKRQRRIATFSWPQYERALEVLQPDYLFINFVNYLRDRERMEFIASVVSRGERYAGRRFKGVFVGYGPRTSNVQSFHI